MRNHTGIIPPFMFASLLVACGPLWAQRGGSVLQSGTSPRIERLRQDVASKTPGVVETFWAGTLRDQAPIIEPVHNDPTHSVVTFVWRGDADTKSVQVLGTDMNSIPGTDIWYATFTLPSDRRVAYSFRPVKVSQPTANPIPLPDPLNSHRFMPPVEQELPASAARRQSPYMSSSILVLPQTPTSPWVDPQPQMAKGHVEERTYESKVFGAQRRIWVYTPPKGGSGEKTPSGLLICLWGPDYLNEIPVPTILDNLRGQGKIPPIVAIFIDNTGDRFQNFQSTEKFTETLSTELIPWARANLKVPADPRRVIVAGYSAAGLESVYVAFKHPELFGNVLSQSGAFWRGFEGEGASEPEWLSLHYAAATSRETKFVLDVGGRETQTPGGVVFKDANAHLRDVLLKKGYTVSYIEVRGGEHEFIHWRSTFGDDLLELTSGWS